MGICEYWSIGPQGPHLEPPGLHFHRPRPPRLYFEPLKTSKFDINADPDPEPAFHSNADPDPASASKINADPCGSGSATLYWFSIGPFFLGPVRGEPTFEPRH